MVGGEGTEVHLGSVSSGKNSKNSYIVKTLRQVVTGNDFGYEVK